MGLTTRTGKGSKLTIEEMDNNLLYLENISSSGSGVPLWEEVNTQTETRVIKYGRLYNWYAVTDYRGLAPSGWRIATTNDYLSINESNELINLFKNNSTYYDGYDMLNYITPNEGYNNENYSVANLYSVFQIMQVNPKNDGYSWNIRLIKDNNINEGDIIIDGDTYNSVTVGDQVWLQQNLAVTHYNNGDLIGSDFTGTTGAVCADNNDESNVYDTLLVGDNNHLKPLDNRKVFSNNVIGLPNDIYIGNTAPTDPLVKIWIDTTVPVVLTDVDILKKFT